MFGLLLELSLVLLLLASATAGILLLLLGGSNRAFRVHAHRWARRAWHARDAHGVLGMTFLLLAGTILSRMPGSIRTNAPPALGALLLSMTPLPVFTLMLCRFRSIAAGTSLPELLGLRRRTWRRDVQGGIIRGVALLVPALALSWISGQILLRYELLPEAQDALRWLHHPETTRGVRTLLLLQAILAAPILEEILYRGVLLSVVLRTLRPSSAVLLTSFFFAALHLQSQVLLPLFFVGMALSVGLLATGSLVTPILMHMVFNAANLWLALAGA